jgi:hypothetical protein
MNEIETVLTEVATLVKTLETTHPVGSRVWVLPGETRKIKTTSFPFAVVSKMSAEEGSWEVASFGEGIHNWSVLIAVYVASGPIVITSPESTTIEALENSHEWYKLLSDLLFENMTLNGSVNIIGDDQGNLFNYVTDNIIWDGQQYWGHLFVLPVRQNVIQGVST